MCSPELGSSCSDRKSTRLNSSHSQISYAVFCLKKKKTTDYSLYMIVTILPVSIFVIMDLWFWLPRCERLMIHTPLAISIFVTQTMVQPTSVYNSYCDVFSFCGAILLAAEGLNANYSTADCYQYFCVPEYGTVNGRLHFHAVHFLRTLPTVFFFFNFGPPPDIPPLSQRVPLPF